MEHDHRRGRVHELPVCARSRPWTNTSATTGRARRADAAARPQLDRHHAEGARARSPMIDIAYVPTMCNHCDNAPCIAKGGDAVKKRDDGIVIIDPEQGQGPQGPRREPAPTATSGGTRSMQLPQLWPFDAHLIDQGWQQTRGQQSCPTGAMRAIKVEDDEMARMAREDKPRGDEARGSAPSRASITATSGATRNASSAAASRRKSSGVVDCVEGASVRLIKDGQTVARDHDRQLRRLQIRQARRELRAPTWSRFPRAARRRASRRKLGASINLGEIRL